jgi:hypothetical protein
MHSFSPNLSCILCSPYSHSNHTWQRVQLTKLFTMRFSPTSCHFICPLVQIFTSAPCSHPQSDSNFYGFKFICILCYIWYIIILYKWHYRQEHSNLHCSSMRMVAPLMATSIIFYYLFLHF